jgi:hypothetical protein
MLLLDEDRLHARRSVVFFIWIELARTHSTSDPYDSSRISGAISSSDDARVVHTAAITFFFVVYSVIFIICTPSSTQ